jgi:hypothetical protein
MWEVETLNGPRLIATLIPDSIQKPLSPESGAAVESTARWRVEVTLEWLPYTHVVAVKFLPTASAEISVNTTAEQSWAHLMLSLKDGRPPLLSVYSAADGPKNRLHAQLEIAKKMAVEVKAAACSYGRAASGRFLYGCDGVEDRSGGTVLVPGGGADGEDVERCGLVHANLSAAVEACSMRGTCRGITLVPGWGFELRSSGQMGK